MAVLFGIGEANQAAVLELDLAGALDLHRIELERIRDPGQHRCVDAAGVDHHLGAREDYEVYFTRFEDEAAGVAGSK